MNDYQRWEEELRRCDLLGAQAQEPETLKYPDDWATLEKITQRKRERSATYHRERARVLRKIGPVQTVAFLREEALEALKPPSEGSVNFFTRWFILEKLERSGGVPPGLFAPVTLMDLRAAEERRRRARSCSWCIGNDGCSGACY